MAAFVCEAVGALAVSAGVAMLLPAAGLIVAGVFLLLFGFASSIETGE